MVVAIETGAESTTIVNIFDIIHQVRDSGIYLKDYSRRKVKE